MHQSAAKNEIYSELRRLLPARLPEFLARQRWFGGKARKILSTEIADMIPMQREGLEALLLIVTVRYVSGSDETYAIPVLHVEKGSVAIDGRATLLEIPDEQSGVSFVAFDATRNEKFLELLLKMIERNDAFHGEKRELRGFCSGEFARLNAASALSLKPRALAGEQSNTCIIYGDRFILKFFRRLEEGINPDLEIGLFLTEKARFTHVPQLAGHLAYRTADGKEMTQGILQRFVPNQGDAWRYSLKCVSSFYDKVLQYGMDTVPAQTGANAQVIQTIPQFVEGTVDPYLSAATLLGKRTAEMHLALASEPADPAFAPEPFSMQFQNAFEESLVELTRTTVRMLREKLPALPIEWRNQAEQIANREREIIQRFQLFLDAPIHAMRTRIHGDYHLGQVLYTGSDFVIIDFEGEPARPLSERRAKRSALQDVAGMLRSFHYAAFAPLLGAAGSKAVGSADLPRLMRWAKAWSEWAGKRFLEEYFTTSKAAAYLPSSREEARNLLALHLLEKAIYELSYELNNRPTWVGIPLEGIAQLLSLGGN